jgi:hypothetical protein
MVSCLGAMLALISVTGEGSRWSRTGNLNRGRSGQEAAGLTDGRFMVLGGNDDFTGYEIFDPATGTWSRDMLPVPDTTRGDGHHMSILLPNGKVLWLPNDGVWLYDPRTEMWNASATTINGLQTYCATLLRNGQLLVMYDGKNCCLYDYMNDTLSQTGSANEEHFRATEILLPSGEVLVAGAGEWGSGSVSGKCELYDPGSGAWRYTGAMAGNRAFHVGILLPPPWSKVLVAGQREATGKCELYDPGSGLWTYTGDISDVPRESPGMVLFPSGKALIVGGQKGASPSRSCEIYDPDARTWSFTDDLQIPRSHFSVMLLLTGKALAVANYSSNIGCEVYDPSDGAWAPRPSLNHERRAHTATLLPIIPTENCSTNVLVVGGENSGGALKSCELYNYSLDSISATGQLFEARSHHTAVLLHSGKVLVAGGRNTSPALRSCELYNAAGESWTTVQNMNQPRVDHTATLLKGGDVLVTGGESLSDISGSCEIYAGGTWISVSFMDTARTRHSAVLLLDGRVLVVGGKTLAGATASCEVWDGASWSSAAALGTARYLHTTTLLQSGKVLIVGGTGDGSTPIASCEIYDPDTDAWTHEADLNHARYLHNSTLLYSGLVLTTGGHNGVSYLSACEIYDPALHSWKDDVTATLATPRAYHSSVLVPDTMPFVVAIGGEGNGTYLNSIEEYDVGLGYRSIWQSTIANYPSVIQLSDSMHINGTLFRGVSEADGGNYCHVVSNDHPIISLVRVGGGNWQGNGGGEILHMPLSSSWDETHTDVHPEIADFQGYFRLWSIVNGIPCKWYKECPTGVGEGTQSTVHSQQSTVFPNPSTCGAGVHFRFGLSTVDRGLSTLTIYDLAGRVVRSIPITKSPFTVDKLKPGIYFYKINCHSELVPACSRPTGRAGRSESHTITGKFTVIE